MSDRNDRPTEYRDGGNGAEAEASRHLSDDQLNGYLDRATSADEAGRIETHLAGCESCRSHLRELRALTTMLSALPDPSLRRSFQLSPEMVSKPAGIWARFGGWLFPALPAMRAATVAVAVLLIVVSARNLADESTPDGQVSDVAIVQSTSIPAVTDESPADGRNSAQAKSNQDGLAYEATLPSQPLIATEIPSDVVDTFTTGTSSNASESSAAGAGADDTGLAAGSQLADGAEGEIDSSAPADADLADGSAADSTLAGGAAESAAADESVPDSASAKIAPEPETTNEESADSAAGSGAAGDSTMAMMVPASPEAIETPTPSPTASATATSTSTATPTATTTPSPAPTAEPVVTRSSTGSDDGNGRWTALQIGLALLLVALIAGLGLTRLGPQNGRKRN